MYGRSAAPQSKKWTQQMGSGTKCSERRSIEKKTKQMVHVENYSIIRTEKEKPNQVFHTGKCIKDRHVVVHR